MNKHIEKLKAEIEPLRQQLIQHPVYHSIKSLTELKIFMEHHVYAVWDFMSLLKSLQRELTCVDVPWIPQGSAETRFLINEIVLGEESDVDEDGKRTSHFELYLKAMEQAGCNTLVVHTFIDHLKHGSGLWEKAMEQSHIPAPSAQFIRGTFTVIEQPAYVQAAVFTFGREDLIPGMFISFVGELDARMENKVSTLKYYLDRHIEVDGDHHSRLAYRMTKDLCGEDEAKWQDATVAVKRALKDRIQLWNSIMDSFPVAASA